VLRELKGTQEDRVAEFLARRKTLMSASPSGKNSNIVARSRALVSLLDVGTGQTCSH